MSKEYQEINLQKTGMKRRKKEVRHMKIMIALTVLFLSVTLLFQDNMNLYQMEVNYKNYGEWLLREPIQGDLVTSPYLEHCGKIWVGSSIYRTIDDEDAAHIEADPQDEERYTGRLLGSLDQEIIQSGKISLYEGKWPEKDDEIAMELDVLQTLGYHYDLGQQITFYISEQENITELISRDETLALHRVTYTLVGTIKSYTTTWSGGDVLPGAVLTKNEFDRLTQPVKGYQFSRIKTEYKDHDVSSFGQKLADSLTKRITETIQGNTDFEEMGYATNEFAYDNPFWSNPVMFRNMTVILIILGISIMSYLMSSYLGKRRKYYYRLREIGATVGQIWNMAAYECISSTQGTALLMLILSYAIGFVIVWGVAQGVQIPFFFVFRWGTLIKILLCVMVVLAISLLCALILFRGKRMTARKNALPKLIKKRLRWRGEKRKRRIRIGEISKRTRICHPISVFFSRIIGVGVCAAILICLMQINERVMEYHNIRNVYRDFEIKTPNTTVSIEAEIVKTYRIVNGEKIAGRDMFGGSQEQRMMYDTIPDSMLQELQELSGVKQMDYATYDHSHVFNWEGKGDSEYFQKHLYSASCLGYTIDDDGNQILIDESDPKGREMLEAATKQMYEGRYYQNTKSVWDDLSRHLDQQVANYQKFCDGKQVILLENTFDIAGEEEVHGETDSTLQTGDTLTIETAGNNLQVEIASILSAEEMDCDYGYGPYSIIGSETLGRQIAKEDGAIYGYNCINIDFNALANSEATDKIVTRKCVRNQLIYKSGSEYIRTYIRKVVQAVLIYGFLAVILFVLYLFVLSCILQEERYKNQRKKQMLHQIGVSYQQLRRLKIRNGITEVLHLFCSIPVVYGIWLIRVLKEYRSDGNVVGMYSHVLHKTIGEINIEKYILIRLTNEVNLWWVCTFMIVMGIAVMGLHLQQEEGNEIHNHSESSN